MICDVTCPASRPRCGAPWSTPCSRQRRIRDWPGALLVVVGPEPARAAGELPTGVAWAPRVGDAVRIVAASAGRGPRSRCSILLGRRRWRGPCARRSRAGVERFADDALLVVDELVANAVLHAGTK